MSFEVKTLPLSALAPVRLTYSYGTAEKLSSEYRVIDSGLRYYKHDLLTNYADGAFSNKNVVVLSKPKDISAVFEQPIVDLNIQSIACSFYLTVPNTDILDGDVVVKTVVNNFYVGGKGTPTVFDTIPIEKGIIELKTSNKQIAVLENYPYDLIVLNEPLQENIERQRFEVDVYDGHIALKSKTKEGYRFLSYGKDRVLRCVGLQLNETRINDYLFSPTFISNDKLAYGFDPSVKEVKYLNTFGSISEEKSINVKTDLQKDTSLLISCPLEEVAASEEVNVNIAITKTNFTTSGTFNTSL